MDLWLILPGTVLLWVGLMLAVGSFDDLHEKEAGVAFVGGVILSVAGSVFLLIQLTKWLGFMSTA